jgi:glycosyltransferase involved in cell wall biosynthesis
LLKAVRKLSIAGEDINLTMVGGGGQLDEIGEFLRREGMQDIVRLAGHQTDVSPFYQSADFVVIPTLVREALGLVSLEARRHSLPALYSGRGGLPETQVHGVTGLMLADPTEDEIMRAVLKIRRSPAVWASMREHAQTGIAAFAIEKMVTAYIEAYTSEFSRMSDWA